MTNEKALVFEVLEDLNSDHRGSGVEVELASDEPAEIREPFDPEKIDVKTKPMTVDLIMARIRGGDEEIDLMPDFQRRAGIWDTHRKSRLIESLLLRIPLPVFYVAADHNDRWSVVDGLQRITTLKEFIHDKTFALEGLEFLHDLRGQRFADLNRQMQRRIQETEITVHIIQPGTPSAVMFNIFKRINTGGLPLSAQEIRHAIKQGQSTRLLKQLAESSEFKSATRGSINDERMADRECVLRFCAFYLNPPQNYTSGDLDALLLQTMDRLNIASTAEIEALQSIFKSAMTRAKDILGKYAFRKYYNANYRLSPINKALFESWSVNLAAVSTQEALVLEQKKDLLFSKFATLMVNIDFVDSISMSTGAAASVKRRFETVKTLIQEVLNA